MKYTTHHEPLSTAKAIVAFLVLAIAFVLFWKFVKYQGYWAQDPNAMRNYVIFAITVSGFLIGLLYLSSQTTHQSKASTHKVKAPTKKVKSSSAKKKKK